MSHCNLKFHRGKPNHESDQLNTISCIITINCFWVVPSLYTVYCPLVASWPFFPDACGMMDQDEPPKVLMFHLPVSHLQTFVHQFLFWKGDSSTTALDVKCGGWRASSWLHRPWIDTFYHFFSRTLWHVNTPRPPTPPKNSKKKLHHLYVGNLSRTWFLSYLNHN